MQYSAELLNRFVAPDVTKLTTVDIPDLRAAFPDAEHWVAHHFLNSALRGHFQSGARQVVLGFIRRAQHGFQAYHDARDLTLAYLERSQPFNPSVTRLYAALARWEEFVLHASIGMDLFLWVTGGRGAFRKNDGSKEFRLYTIANQVKHLRTFVDSGQCSADDTVPLWLTNDGLASFGVTTTFSETSEVLKDLATAAEQLQDPKGFVESRSAQSP